MKHRNITSLISVVNKHAGRYFEKFQALVPWKNRMNEIEDTHENIASLSGQAKFFLGALLFLCFFIVCVDYGTIKPFVEGLSDNASGLIGYLILFLGAFLPFSFEFLAGLLRRNGKKQDRILIVFLSTILGLVVCALPAFTIYKTYQITPEEDRDMILYNKTIAYMLFSFVIHLLSFLLIDKIIDAFQWLVYSILKWWHNLSNPLKDMKQIRKELIDEFENFNRNLNRIQTTEEKTDATANMSKRAWYLRQKFSDGDVTNDYDLNDYDENLNYSPFASTKNNNGPVEHAEVADTNGKYRFGGNGNYSYTVS